MEFTLTIVAIVSAATALVMTAIVVSMLRNERRRSDARVEALVRLANADVSMAAQQGPAPVPVASVAIPVSQSFSAVTPSAREVKRAPVPALRISDEFADEPQAPKGNVTAGERAWVELDLQPVAGVGGLFAEPANHANGAHAAIAAHDDLEDDLSFDAPAAGVLRVLRFHLVQQAWGRDTAAGTIRSTAGSAAAARADSGSRPLADT